MHHRVGRAIRLRPADIDEYRPGVSTVEALPTFGSDGAFSILSRLVGRTYHGGASMNKQVLSASITSI